jgi:hypothetical protein
MVALDEARSRARGSTVLAALMVAVLWAPEVHAQSSCVVNRATFGAFADCAQTDSTDFINIPHAALDVTVGGSAPTCVIVSFSAQTKTASKENMDVRAKITGVGIGEPEDVTFGSGTGELEARATQFVFANVPPGDHTVHIQYRSAKAGTVVKLCEPTVVVHHR